MCSSDKACSFSQIVSTIVIISYLKHKKLLIEQFLL
jgi:hypothetical protein